MAWHQLEGGAGGIGAALIVARHHGAGALPLDQHLRAAEHVAGRVERHRHVADGDPFAVGRGLGARAGRRAEPGGHHPERLARGKHVIMPGPGVIGMAMGDDGALGPAIRVDVKAAGPAIEALPVDREPAVESIGSHFFPGCAEQITVYALTLQLLPVIVVNPVVLHAVAKPPVGPAPKMQHSRGDAAGGCSPWWGRQHRRRGLARASGAAGGLYLASA